MKSNDSSNTNEPAERLSELLPKSEHACSSGDCGHDNQSQCDETLARDYPEPEQAGVSVPECPRYMAHPQAVWFEIHWRPIIDKLKAELTATQDTAEQLHALVTATAKERDSLREELERARETMDQLYAAKEEWATRNDMRTFGKLLISDRAQRKEIDRLTRENAELKGERDEYKTLLESIAEGRT